jgi:hypothetical protein
LPGAEEGICGFDAVFADGTRVLCQAAPVQGRLQVADLTAVAEQLVLTQTAGGERRGIVLGCRELKIAGQAVASLPGPDFEFTLAKQNTFKPIYYPLGLVRILPQADCFVDEVQVTLEPPASGVDIRYTMDLSDPDGNSPLYTGPFKVRYTTTVKVRAFRKGVTRVPPTFDNTLVSAVSRAQFTKLPYRAPAATASKTPAPGLNVSYFEGDGRLSALFLAQRQPVKQGQARELFDLSLRQTSNNYAFVYTGYLDIPQDGVYSFYAPMETFCPKIDAGYDLRVFVGGVEWYPGTRWHNLGIWSVPLKRGLHQLQVMYVDQRPSQAQWQYYPYTELESFIVWRGVKPVLEISGPGLPKQPIPAKMLFH